VSERSREPIESPARRQALNGRLRIAFIAGAEEGSRSRLGRGLSEEKLQRVLRRYPCDLPERYRAGFRPARIHLDGEG